jgi:hypothetical protein
MTNKVIFGVLFGSDGFEGTLNLTEIYEQEIVDKLHDRQSLKTVAQMLGAMELRARANQHRKVQLWLITFSDDMDIKTLREWQDTEPQSCADYIRANGECAAGADGRRCGPVSAPRAFMMLTSQ